MRTMRADRWEIPTESGLRVLVRRAKSPSDESAIPENLDLYVRRAAVFIQDLLPSTQIVLTYFGPRSEMPHFPHTNETGWTRVSAYGTSVPDEPEWFRYLEIWMQNHTTDLLTFDRPDISWADEQIRTYLPREFDFLGAHAFDVASLLTHAAVPGMASLRVAALNDIPALILTSLVTTLVLPDNNVTDPSYQELMSVVLRSFTYIDRLSGSRYEGDSLSHGVVIGRRSLPVKRLSTVPYPDNVTTLKRSTLIANGYDALLVVDRAGYPIKLEENRGLDVLAFVTRASRTGVSIMLTSNGTVVVCVRGRPVVVRRGGIWRALLWEVIESAIGRSIGTERGRIVAQAVLLNSFSGHGCLVGLDTEGEATFVQSGDDVEAARAAAVRDTDDTKWPWHRSLPGSDVRSLGAALLARIASVDGSTLVSAGGTLTTYGHIVRSGVSPLEGARTAAARTLSKKGLVIKVSEDGPISVWTSGQSVLEV